MDSCLFPCLHSHELYKIVLQSAVVCSSCGFIHGGVSLSQYSLNLQLIVQSASSSLIQFPSYATTMNNCQVPLANPIKMSVEVQESVMPLAPSWFHVCWTLPRPASLL